MEVFSLLEAQVGIVQNYKLAYALLEFEVASVLGGGGIIDGPLES